MTTNALTHPLSLDYLFTIWNDVTTQPEKIRLVSEALNHEGFKEVSFNLEALLQIGEKNREILELITQYLEFY